MIKQKAMYEIRVYTDACSYSKTMSFKLRTRQAATRLVKRLKKMGHDAFASKMMVSV
jgi:hypothetical protein